MPERRFCAQIGTSVPLHGIVHCTIRPNVAFVPSGEGTTIYRRKESCVGTRPFRTYKLRLSPEGIALFLTCHCRLARVAGEFIPYGATLFVSVSLLEREDVTNLLGEFSVSRWRTLAGDSVHYVGASTRLADMTARISADLADAPELVARPSAAHIHLASLRVFAATEDDQLSRAYRDASPYFMVPRRTRTVPRKTPWPSD